MKGLAGATIEERKVCLVELRDWGSPYRIDAITADLPLTSMAENILEDKGEVEMMEVHQVTLIKKKWVGIESKSFFETQLDKILSLCAAGAGDDSPEYKQVMEIVNEVRGVQQAL